MAVISALNVYPVKGCKGITVPEVELAETGLRFDRHWVVTDEDGRFVTQRELPRMALISTQLDGEALVLNAPEMEPLVLPVLQIGERVSVTVWARIASTNCKNARPESMAAAQPATNR